MRYKLKDYTDFLIKYPAEIQEKANTLLDSLQKKGIKLENAIPVAINQTREWALEQGIKFSTGERKQSKQVWFVIPNNEGWIVKNKSEDEILETLPTKSQAINYGKVVARRHEGVLVVKGKNDEVQGHFAFMN